MIHLNKSCQNEPSIRVPVQEQPSGVDYPNKKFLSSHKLNSISNNRQEFLSVDTQAKLVMIDQSCQYEPSSPISVQEQPSDVDYLNKMFLSVDTQAKLTMIDKSC